jgi:hypothetical protein
MDTSTVIQSIIGCLPRAMRASDPKSTWFIDNEPDSGILGLIAVQHRKPLVFQEG